MSYVPADVRWFVAELVEEITVEGDPRNVVHRNLVLIEASSAEEAYRESWKLGEDSSAAYDNPHGRRVRITFRGISELNVVGKELTHGTEILFREDIGVREKRILQWVLPKERLAVFLPIEASAGPNYASREVIEEVGKLITGKED